MSIFNQYDHYEQTIIQHVNDNNEMATIGGVYLCWHCAKHTAQFSIQQSRCTQYFVLQNRQRLVSTKCPPSHGESGRVRVCSPVYLLLYAALFPLTFYFLKSLLQKASPMTFPLEKENGFSKGCPLYSPVKNTYQYINGSKK